MKTINLNKKVSSIEVGDNRIIINLEQCYVPEDGEYFYLYTVADNEFIGIRKKGDEMTNSYCSFDVRWGILDLDHGRITFDKGVKEIRPATMEEKEFLDRTLKEYGKKWNPETNQLDDLPRVGDFCIFWCNNKARAFCTYLESIYENEVYKYTSTAGTIFKNCIPFKSIAHFNDFIRG